MVDEERVVRLLAGVRADLAALERASARLGADAEADELALAGAKYLFVTAIEGCAKVAQHTVASEGWAAPDSDADAVRRLGDHGVLDAHAAEVVGRAVGFRNVLVHGYIEVDDDEVAANLGRLEELGEFVRQVATWLARESGTG